MGALSTRGHVKTRLSCLARFVVHTRVIPTCSTVVSAATVGCHVVALLMLAGFLVVHAWCVRMSGRCDNEDDRESEKP